MMILSNIELSLYTEEELYWAIYQKSEEQKESLPEQ